MAEKVGGSASLLNNLWTLWTLWTNVPSVYFFRKVSIFFRKSCSESGEAAKRNTSGHCGSRFCSLLPIWSASSGVLFVGCWYYLQKSERFTPPTAHRMAPSRFARLWAFGRRAQAIHHQAVYRYDTVAVEKAGKIEQGKALPNFAN